MQLAGYRHGNHCSTEQICPATKFRPLLECADNEHNSISRLVLSLKGMRCTDRCNDLGTHRQSHNLPSRYPGHREDMMKRKSTSIRKRADVQKQKEKK